LLNGAKDHGMVEIAAFRIEGGPITIYVFYYRLLFPNTNAAAEWFSMRDLGVAVRRTGGRDVVLAVLVFVRQLDSETSAHRAPNSVGPEDIACDRPCASEAGLIFSSTAVLKVL
jgi:hypothetical protein